MEFFKSNKQSYSDDELLTLLKKSGDRGYFDVLYERYIPLTYGLCLKYLKEPSKAQDAVIDIFESISEKIANYEIKTFKNWLYSVVKNHCFHLLKENKKEIVVDFNSQVMESDSVIDLYIEDVNLDKEKALNQCIEKLPEPQAISVRLFYFENQSYLEIVKKTGFHLKSVKSYIQNGKRNLKICIENLLEE